MSLVYKYTIIGEYTKKGVIPMRCPVCQQHDPGKVGSRQFYCSKCLIEFKVTSNHQYRLYYVDADGSLIEMQENEIKHIMQL